MEAKLKALIVERASCKSRLTIFRKHVESPGEDIGAFEDRLKLTDALYEKFDKIQTEIEALVFESQYEEAQINERESFETSYHSARSKAREYIKRVRGLPVSAASPSLESQTSVDSRGVTRLPKVKLPTFNGNYDDWVRFRDTFERLVHNNEALSDIERFDFLDSAIKGDAARVIKSMGVSETNYQNAWDSLKRRYEDPNSLVHYHVRELFDFPALQRRTSEGIREFHDNVRSHVLSLKALDEPVNYWDTLLVFLISKKLDSTTKWEWDQLAAKSKDKIRFDFLLEFLEEQARALERGKPPQVAKTENRPMNRKARDRTNLVAAHSSCARIQCALCKGNHALHNCQRFIKMTPLERHAIAKGLRSCINCLQQGHSLIACTHTACSKCGRKHHTLLHRESTQTIQHNNCAEPERDTPPTVLSCFTNTMGPVAEYSVLSTAVVFVEDRSGRMQNCRALLDMGSQAHFITENLSNRLGIPKIDTNLAIGGLGGLTSAIRGKVNVAIIAREGKFRAPATCLVIRNITEDMPNVPINKCNISIPQGLTLADPCFDRPGKIDLLIGAGLFWNLTCAGQHRVPKTNLVWQNTRLGWVLGGSFKWPVSHHTKTTCHAITNASLHRAISRFWEMENPEPVAAEVEIDAGNACEGFFRQVTTRNEDGRFIVGIPFNSKILQLGESRSQAEKRFLSLERKLARNPDLKSQYIKFMMEYEALGHMSLRAEPQISRADSGYYLPHHAVFKGSSTTTKIRVVFDGSAKTSSGISLNDAQIVGPTVQSSLLSILLRFRKHRYVLSADIEKMYRQIHVRPQDRRYQRILWRRDDTSALLEYELNTVTYGTGAASFLATRALRQLGEEHAISDPAASRIIIEDFYVDDLLTGCDGVHQAIKLRNRLEKILEGAGLPLRKWASNDPQIVATRTSAAETKQIKAIDKDPKTLGLLWSPETDELKYTVKSNGSNQVTKRTILSEISQIFDPLGLIGPVIITAKMLMQRIWQLNVGWDECLPQSISYEWSSFREELRHIRELKIPRYVPGNSTNGLELHGFADASERAYGAAIYLRECAGNGRYRARLLCAKSRVAPLKTLSLPRLELCGALLMAKLVSTVRRALGIHAVRHVHWSDSTITLAWIRGQPNRWKTFVANRVSEIQQLTDSESWRHVPSGENPADLLSRGVAPAQMEIAELWWHGPSWLSRADSQWPTTETLQGDIPETKGVGTTCLTAAVKQKVESFEVFRRFSSYSKLKITIAYCLRYLDILRKRIESNTTERMMDEYPERPGLPELARAEMTLIRLAQRETWAEEIKTLKAGKNLQRGNPLLSLSAFLDDDTVIRVGGRLANASISFEHKHPRILPSKHPLTNLIIEHEHCRLLHAGYEQTLASLREKYWPIGGRCNVRAVLRRCVRCFRVNPIQPHYLMGNLPAPRVSPTRPFHTCGVDYAGPVIIKDQGRSRVSRKTYICIFVCFSTKAVHIELATELTSQAFLNCLRRFISRRGRSHCIYSDNGTNFIGARNELRELGILLKDKSHHESVERFSRSEEMQWRLIPPHSPHFGGLWESAFKSAKTHLKKVIGEQRLTYEELYTVLTQIEACLNSRPLHPISSDPTDFTPLTPGHFLIGDALTALPHPDVTHIRSSRLDRFQLLQSLIQHFWRRWHNEYLHGLQQKRKWQADSPNTNRGTLALLREDHTPPLKWKLGRIEEVHPGPDGRVRVVSVRTPDGIFKRPVVKVSPLPNAQEDDIPSRLI